MAKNHCKENRLTFVLQYPKGMFRMKTRIVMKISVVN